MEQLMYRPVEAAQVLGIGRTSGLCADQVRPACARSSSAAPGSSPLTRCGHSSRDLEQESSTHDATRRWRDA